MIKKLILFILFLAIIAILLTIFLAQQKQPVLAIEGPNASSASDFFPIGVFEDANMVEDAKKFETMLNNLQSHHLDSVLFTNNFSKRDVPLLDVSDRLNANVFMLPAGDLNDTWWLDTVPSTIRAATSAASPIVDRFSSHPSFKGYVIKDEPELRDLTKVALLAQAFHALDSVHPAMPILVGVDRVGPIFNAAQSDAMLIDVYPIGYWNALCDFTMTGFGYSNLDMVDYVRGVTQNKPPGTPLWVILQTQRFGNGEGLSLREPATAEVRIQQWIAIGEGATGIFWFIYSSEQDWTGLVDNPKLYSEVAQLAKRLEPMQGLLLGVRKVEDKFTIEGQHNPYVSTLASRDGGKILIVAVNRDCENFQTLKINSTMLRGQLRDVESSKLYAMNAPIVFQPGDGKIFELVNADTSALR